MILTRGDDLVLDPLAAGSDVGDFDAALERGDHDAAIALYRGPFLDGFVLGGSVEFEHWVDEERNRYARRYKEAHIARAEDFEAAGDHVAAADAWRKAANADRFDSRIALRLLRALDAAGNRAGALQFARIHEALLEQEFGTEPDPAFTAAVEEVRSRTEPAVPARADDAASGPPPDPRPEPRSDPAPPTTADVTPDATPDATPDTAPGTAPASRPASRPDRAADHAAEPPPRSPAWRLPLPRHRRGVIAVGVLLVAAIVIGYVGTRWGADRPPGEVRVAVVPFAHPDSADEAFADGLSEQIMDALANVEGVAVPAWSAALTLRGSDAREAASQLGVDHIVEGSVHRDGDSLRVRVRLSGRDGFARWTESYDRAAGEVFATWDEIAVAVLDALEVHLAPGGIPAQAGGTRDLVAYDLFLKGRHAWLERRPGGLARAIAYFREAVARDPDYADAHAALADVYNVLGAYDYGLLPPDSAFPRALEEAGHAIELAPELGTAYAARANARFGYNRDWEGADRDYRRAIALYPHYADAHHWYSLFLIARGDEDAAMREARTALQLDSLSAITRANLARHRYFRGDAAGALEAYRRAIEADPYLPTAHYGAGTALLELGRYDDAVATFQEVLRQSDRPVPIALALLGNALGRAGRTDDARDILARLRQLRAEGAWVASEHFALVHLGLGDHDAAIDALQDALRERTSGAPFFGIEPLIRPLWENPRFQTLIEAGRRPVGDRR